MIHVIAIITTQPGLRDSVLAHFRANVPAVLAENGCIEYGATVDAEGAPPFGAKFGPDTFVVEKWADSAALAAHAAAPHMAAYAAKTRARRQPRDPGARADLSAATLADGALRAGAPAASAANRACQTPAPALQ